MLMVLHHIDHIEQMLLEISRILKPNGLFIIREHDCTPNSLSLILDIMHGLYARVWSEPAEMSSFCDNYHAHYYSQSSLNSLIQSYHFIHHHLSPSYHHIPAKQYKLKDKYQSNHHPYVKNCFKYYYALYQNNKTVKRQEQEEEEEEAQEEEEGPKGLYKKKIHLYFKLNNICCNCCLSDIVEIV